MYEAPYPLSYEFESLYHCCSFARMGLALNNPQQLICPWETLAVRKKASRHKNCFPRNPTNINTQKLKKAQNELTSKYLKELIEYAQNQINKIRLKRNNLGWHGRQ